MTADGLNQRRAAAQPTTVTGRSGASANSHASASAASTSYFSSNASKRRGEMFFLGWGAVWISIMAFIVATRWFEVGSRSRTQPNAARCRSALCFAVSSMAVGSQRGDCVCTTDCSSPSLIRAPVLLLLCSLLRSAPPPQDFTPTHYMVTGLVIALPPMILPLLFPGSDASIPWAQRYTTKANVWIFILSWMANYFWTHYFYQVLGATYTFAAWRLNDVSGQCSEAERGAGSAAA